MKKNIIIIIFIIIGLLIIYNFRDHNQKRAIDACIAGSQKLDKPMSLEAVSYTHLTLPTRLLV